jgi:hypothetical protein
MDIDGNEACPLKKSTLTRIFPFQIIDELVSLMKSTLEVRYSFFHKLNSIASQALKLFHHFSCKEHGEAYLVGHQSA